jgi:hypothetical protein
MVWLPTVRADVLNDAWPEPFTVTFDAQTVVPSVKVTFPAGVPAPEVVDEVKVTDWPKVEGFGVELAVVAVAIAAAGFTNCDAALPLLFDQPVLPVKVAVMVWLPTVSAEVLNEAWPELTGTFDAQTVNPSVNVTVPAGVPEVDVVVEVKVTDWPKVEGFGVEVAVVRVVALTI